jgi:site-specific recombinase XerC
MLYGAHPATIRFYRKGWTAFKRRGLPTTLETIKTAIVGMRESGLGIGGANNYIRAWQVFCNWLADRGHIERFRIPHIPQQKTRKPVLFDQEQAIGVIRYEPKPPSVRRAQSMFALMLDTAIRFGECVSIFEAILMRARG